MFYGEHLSAVEVSIKCPCGVTATVEVNDKNARLCGWCCRSCAVRARKKLRRHDKLAKAIVRTRP